MIGYLVVVSTVWGVSFRSMCVTKARRAPRPSATLASNGYVHFDLVRRHSSQLRCMRRRFFLLWSWTGGSIVAVAVDGWQPRGQDGGLLDEKDGKEVRR